MSFYDLVLAVLALVMLVVIYRLVTGPSDGDRVLALDFGFAVFIAGLGVLAVRLDTPAMIDLVLAATLIGFLATVIFAHLVERRARR